MKLSNKVKISIIINCFNGEKYLRNCIESVFKQRYKNFEIVFWDNNSSDNSRVIAEQYNDKRIKIYSNDITDKLYKARNKAIEKSQGELIAFLDCDDWWEPNYLSSRVDAFDDLKFDFFYSNTNLYFDKNKQYKPYRKKKLPSGNIFRDLSKDYFICISGLIVRKNIFIEIGKFNENFNIIGDFDFVMRMSKKYLGKGDNKFLLNYRVHDDNFLKKNREMYFKEYRQWFKNIDKKSLDKNDFRLILNMLNYLEISYLIEKLKNLNLLIKIIKHRNFFQKIKFFILFFFPIKVIKFLRR